MAGRVDDVVLDPVMVDRRVLGEDRDPTLPLERVRVHGSSLALLAFAINAALTEHRVDQSRLAVVDVRDDRDVADVGTGSHKRLVYHNPGFGWPEGPAIEVPSPRSGVPGS